MVIDTSAVVAILEDEPERRRFIDLIVNAPVRRMSAASYVEASIVLSARRGRSAVHDLMLFLTRAGITIVPVTEADAHLAVDAYQRHGKGVAPAGLNYGNVFSYALARRLNVPLLYKGGDFAKTDITGATDG